MKQRQRENMILAMFAINKIKVNGIKDMFLVRNI